MENKDLVISNTLKQIEEKKKSFDSFKPDAFYKFKTNCRFGDKNVKAMNLCGLLKCYVEAKQFKDTLESVLNAFGFISLVYKNEKIYVDLYGFSAEDWMTDLEYLIKKEVYKDATANLENSAYQLEQLALRWQRNQVHGGGSFGQALRRNDGNFVELRIRKRRLRRGFHQLRYLHVCARLQQ